MNSRQDDDDNDDASSQKNLQFVKLVSAEGSEFYIDRRVAISASKTIRTMLEGQFREAKDNVITFPEISNYILERVLQYLYYNAKVRQFHAMQKKRKHGSYPYVVRLDRWSPYWIIGLYFDQLINYISSFSPVLIPLLLSSTRNPQVVSLTLLLNLKLLWNCLLPANILIVKSYFFFKESEKSLLQSLRTGI